ncbi:ATPase family AAA domain-containing protein 3B [Aspergillus awamori]|uniref:ATPase family AAA domain-containing protein 3B n=1 Tax=Aspergillus awamori TaxID=105351 RepID=A0A401KEE7_ASPAW|nr:ATPase family AAA domain-containing protein 3B [Aspergillus awamori]
MAYTGVETSVVCEVVDSAKRSTPGDGAALPGSEQSEQSEDLFKPIKYTYDCYNWDGADFKETHDVPLQLKVVKEPKQVPPTEEPSCVFEIVTNVEVELPPGGMPEEAETPSLDFMKVKRMKKAKMIIYSLSLLDAIREVVMYYPSQNLVGDEVTVHEPYRVLIHHIRELRELRERLDTSIAANPVAHLLKKCLHLNVLLHFLDPIVQRVASSADKRLLKETPTVIFEDIWYLLKPGTLSYFLNDDIWLGGIIESVQYREKTDDVEEAWMVSVVFQDSSFHQHVVGRAPRQISIEAFDGEKVVTTLPVFPCQFHDSQDNGTRRAAFQRRGGLVRDIIWSGYKYMKYSGTDRLQYDGPVIIGPCDIQVEFPESDWTFDWRPGSDKNAKVEDDPNPISPMLPLDLNASECSKSLLSDEHLFMACPVMAAFALLTKTWELVNVDYAEQLEKAATIPDANIKPENLEIIKALSDRQIKTQNPWSADFIKDKGEGVVVLLHGPPGVGKTYTVESIAMNTGRPLISLTIADLGTKEESIETHLTSWFALAQKWRAILLLDEADIFLERREHKDIARNGIVSAFLRKMEFFKGLLFLTTNRVGHIDEAFISRVHVIIGFEKLDPEKRKKIWKSFLDKLHGEQRGKIRVTAACAQFLMGNEMSAMDWNGREIRNALQTAIALAEYDMRRSEYYHEGDEITVESDHFKKVMEMNRSFRKYMDSIRNNTEEKRAQIYYGRNDSFTQDGAATATAPF